MEIMQATVARKMTIEAIEAKRARMLDMINTRILTNISLGEFKCNFRIIDSPAVQNDLFDYFTALGYTVHFSQTDKHALIYGSDTRIVTISWEETQ